MRPWRALLAEIDRARGARVVISSEWFADARDEAIRLLVRDLDPSRLHVVVTLRPLASILASQWQQLVQGGMTTAWLDWLQAVFDRPESAAGVRFWHRHRHDRLIERWAAVVGPDRVIAVVADDRDRTAVLRAFERLTGLAAGTLTLDPDRANRSLTSAEAELIRATNLALPTMGIDGAARLELVLFGAAANLRNRAPAADEPRIELPPWAARRAADVAREIVAGIRASAVGVVGDLDRLATSKGARTERRATARTAGPTGEAAWAEITAAGAMGVLVALGLARSSRAVGRAVDVLSASRIRSVVMGRIRDAVTGGVRALRATALAR
jgi:hypothetical protein